MSTEDKFLAAVDIVNSLPTDGTFQPSNELLLKLYAYYKQATEGPCTVAKPSYWYYSNRNKWNAWNELQNMPRKIAMEKYVEELTKVIETMSYNEPVSKFMSLIGPFYEVVSAEDVDMEQSEKSNKQRYSGFPYPVKNFEDFQDSKDEHLKLKPLELSQSTVSKNDKATSPNSQLFRQCSISDSSVAHPNAMAAFKRKTVNMKSKSYVGQQDLLILAVINLKNSLEDIVRKFDNLQILAKSGTWDTQFGNSSESKDWNLSVGGTALALLWPIVVHMCARSF